MNSYELLQKELQALVGGGNNFLLTQPEELAHGDYATNIAFILSKQKGISPKECAIGLVNELMEKLSSHIEKIEVAGPGFINFFLKNDIRSDEAEEIATHGVLVPHLSEKALVEYTDPNCFKVFHIGHLMANTIGESLSRIYEMRGYDVMRVCYPSDIGRNVAMGVWGVMQKANEKPKDDAPLSEKIAFLGKCYSYAHKEFESNEESKNAIIEVNKVIYNRSDATIMAVYVEGRQLSLDYFDSIYDMLGTTFDAFIYESEVADEGLTIVKEYLKKGLFEESDGAVVYKGEQDGLHTRVFINSVGLPTYEAKDIGNYEKKLKLLPDASFYVVVTASEQNEYFKVVNTVATKIHKELAGKLVHTSHGMMRLEEGKMSSRTGNVIGGEDLLLAVKERLKEKLDEMRVDDSAKAELLNDIAVGAIKFSILKIAPGKDIIFDFEKSISFLGDSGPYLQYTHARLSALLDNAKESWVSFEHGYVVEFPEKELEKVLLGYKEVMDKAYRELGPHHIIQYLLLLTRVFNSMYARVQIVDKEDKDNSGYYVMLATATKNILAHGLYTLGIKAPERM